MQLPWKRLGNNMRWPEGEARIHWVHQWQNAEGREAVLALIPGGAPACPKGVASALEGSPLPAKQRPPGAAPTPSATRMLPSGFSPPPSYISAQFSDTWPVTTALGFCLDFCRLFIENDGWKVKLPKTSSPAAGVLLLGCSSLSHPLERLPQR